MMALVSNCRPDCFIYCMVVFQSIRSVEPMWSTRLHGLKERLRRLAAAAEVSASKVATRARRAATAPQQLQVLARSCTERDPTSQTAALTQGWDLVEVAAVTCTYHWTSPRR